MRAAVFQGAGSIRILDVPMPAVGPEDVLVQVESCGICGTDVHIFHGRQGAAQTTPPTILGHEFSGVVAAAGQNVHTLQIGDRVCVDPNQLCGACGPCKSGRGHFCTAMTCYGTTSNGGFAQYCAVAAKQVYRLAPEVSFDIGCMAEPVSCCLHGIDLCGIRPGDTVLVIGGGPIGQIMLQLARLSGAAVTVLSEPVEAKRRQALSLGTDFVLDPAASSLPEQLASCGLVPAAVIECVGLPSTMRQAIQAAAPTSTVMLFGLGSPGDEIPLRPFEVFQKELTIRSSFINPYTMERAVNLINSGRLRLAELVAASISLDSLEHALSSPSSNGKVIVHPNGG